MASAQQDEANLQPFLQWLEANGGQLRGCTIKSCGPNKGFGVFTSTSSSNDGVAMVVPLDLAITPMRVLQDPFMAPICRSMYADGDVDDRFLIMLFLTIERLRPDSLWKPYLDMLPKTFGNPLWFKDDELVELKGTTLYRASQLQRRNLQVLYNEKVKGLVNELLGCDERAREVQFEDFLWANSIFWTRALNIPFPRSYVFPESVGGQGSNPGCQNSDFDAPLALKAGKKLDDTNVRNLKDGTVVSDKKGDDYGSRIQAEETLWVEGLVPGIDFCNHGLMPVATWEVDRMGFVTGIPSSMYLMLAVPGSIEVDKEISISYGDKGNEELLYLYGFVIDNNPGDFLMVHYPMEAFQNLPLFEGKGKLLELQKAELRCLLPKSLLDNGFSAGCHKKEGSQLSSYSWSGQRKVPSYLQKSIFPQEFMAALRTIKMQDHEHMQVTSLLEELVESRDGGQTFDVEVQAAVWETCGDHAALELLVDLLCLKLTELEDGSGPEETDSKLLEDFCNLHMSSKKVDEENFMTRNRWSCIVYRAGQKQLTRLFLKEAERALELFAGEQP
ncbi:[Fructose-bisphosphate aldolase]-lysine N-methyltransferase, chloroplastic [Apostasia shenzhenica]|uniref:[Fructose-bisphosphate aldolase]-lysine N-methyltransferase, chloroplastic n=1 Tax=Apostasia shenzhenica TaxID=1088818 RepID=A0A2I0AB43_9ASPA|nr:[Fructose-bisphosphate aldolase]-lysine N-methyltransferase, chloroplastic [Apostasia shenzhenica]